MLQLINYYGESQLIKNKDVTISSIDSPKSLDEFEINIIDLNQDEFWCSKNKNCNSIECIQDFTNLNKMIKNSSKTKVVIILPQNRTFNCNYYSGQYNNYIELKNMVDQLIGDIIYELLGFTLHSIIYENTKTDISGNDIDSSFYFNCNNDKEVMTKSKKGLKPTSILYNKILITTLNLYEYEDIINLLKKVEFIEDKMEIPQWVLDLEMFDDIEQKETINANTKTIKDCEEIISAAQIKMEENGKYKSVLYTNGDELVKVVFEMLEQLMECDLSDFEDEKKEDFLIKKDGITFIGEIKGVTSNVKSEHVSQLEVHLQTYLDKNTENQITEEVKSLLIINPLRNCDLKDRQPVHEIQINLATKYGSLIIETSTLLKLFEMLKRHEISSNECIDLFKDRTGLLEL